jgi:hypothetical protein
LKAGDYTHEDSAIPVPVNECNGDDFNGCDSQGSLLDYEHAGLGGLSPL